MSKTAPEIYKRRLAQLERRRNHLDRRVVDYKGKNPSFDIAEAAALDWAIKIIEAHKDTAVMLIKFEEGSPPELS